MICARERILLSGPACADELFRHAAALVAPRIRSTPTLRAPPNWRSRPPAHAQDDRLRPLPPHRAADGGDAFVAWFEPDHHSVEATALLGRATPLRDVRGRSLDLASGLKMRATVHPYFLLRLTDEEPRRREWRAFLADLREMKETAEA